MTYELQEDKVRRSLAPADVLRRDEERRQREAELDLRVQRITRAAFIGVPVLIALMYLAYRYWPDPTFVYTPGSIVQQMPAQSPTQAKSFAHKGTQVIPVADFTVSGLVLSKQAYEGDPLSAVSRWDLALGWGAMSDPAVLTGVEVRQRERGTRFAYHRVPQGVPWKSLMGQMSNIITIPATAAIEQQLEELPPGHVATLSGKLVSLSLGGLSGFAASSTSRYDNEAGAAELMWVESVTWVSTDEWKLQHPVP